MGAVSPEAAAASRELDLNTSLVPVQPEIPVLRLLRHSRPSPAPVENMPLPIQREAVTRLWGRDGAFRG